MLHNNPYIMNSFLTEFPGLVLRHGGNLSELCESVGLPIESVTQRHTLIPFQKFIFLLEKAANTFDYQDLAFELASRQSIDLLGPISLLLENCKTFDEAFYRILKYFGVLMSGIRIEVKTQEDLLEMIFHVNMPLLVHRRQFQNYLLASTVSVMRNLVAGKFPIRGCYFTRNEIDSIQHRKYADFFGCPVAFGADSIRLTFNTAIMGRAVNYASQETQGLMMGFSSEFDLASQLESIVPLYLSSGHTNLSTIAKVMGYSTGTFRRRLKDASISFSDTLDSIRLSHANQYLKSTHYTLKDIALLLGYKNQSAFTRSYTRWCGVTPSRYRQSLTKI